MIIDFYHSFFVAYVNELGYTINITLLHTKALKSLMLKHVNNIKISNYAHKSI